MPETEQERAASADWLKNPPLGLINGAGIRRVTVTLSNVAVAREASSRELTPKPIIARLNAAAQAALADPQVRKRLDDLGQEIPTLEQQTPEALGALQTAEIARWWPVIKAANIRGE